MLASAGTDQCHSSTEFFDIIAQVSHYIRRMFDILIACGRLFDVSDPVSFSIIIDEHAFWGVPNYFLVHPSTIS